MSEELKKGATVCLIAGNHKGLTGKVLSLDRQNGRVVIEGVNLVKRSSKRTQASPQGGFVEREASVHVSNVRILPA